MSTLAVNTITDANGGSNTLINGVVSAPGGMMFRNRIINGDMRIDQRNAGAEVNPAVNGTYYVDRWFTISIAASKFKVEQTVSGVSAPAGFTDYLAATSLSSYSVGVSETFSLNQSIEGLNCADLAWGTSSAAAVTLSFWVRSSLTGTFGGVVRNSTPNRTYVFSYSINSADTWEYKTITIPGDTTGTWLTTNEIGLRLTFSIGSGSSVSNTAGSWYAGSYTGVTGGTSVVGTNGATFYITGVQLEVGSVATPFERRPYGTELALCQRYYYKASVTGGTTDFWFGNGTSYGADDVVVMMFFPVTMRTAPTALETSGTASDYRINAYGLSNSTLTSVPIIYLASNFASGVRCICTGTSFTSGFLYYLRSNNTANATLAWSAEI